MVTATTEALNKKRVLVTGGAGFVGSSMVARLLDLEARVTVLDDLFTGTWDAIPDDGSIHCVEGSVTDIDLVRKLVGEADVVIHAAARNIIASTRNPREDFETNIGGTLNVLMAARDAAVERVVYTSSASVYGNGRHLPIVEDDTPVFLSPYSTSKFGGEGYCQSFYESYGVPVAVVRYSNVYGVRQKASNPYCGVVAKFFESAMSGRPLAIHGDGLQTRDFTYVADAVDATLVAAVHPRAVGEVFNVGTGIETSVETLAASIMQITNATGPLRHVDRRDIDNIRRRVVSIEKIRRMLHWVPSYTLKNGLQATYDWLVERDGPGHRSERVAADVHRHR